MFISHYFYSAVRVAVAGLAILATACFSAAGQTSTGSLPHPTPTEIAAGDELSKGVTAYKGARYDEAIMHFQKASELEPDLLLAKSYLATALSQNVVPGLTTPENLKIAQRAIDLFQQYLKTRPHDVNTMKQIAGVYFSIKKLDDAKAWQKKVLDEDPRDPEAAYTVGVIDWIEAHHHALEALMPVGLTDDGEGNAGAPAEVMAKIKAQNGELVEEGLQYFFQAVRNRPNYDDAMAYLNLIYRRKADLDFGDEEARKDDVANAEEWASKWMEARKANAERSAGTEAAKP